MQQFNLRVYGICIYKNCILLSDEKVGNFYFTKLPGGGMNFGEGTLECLKREFLEEANLEIEIIEHFYTTDFFMESAFKKGDQIISIYYKVNLLQQNTFAINENAIEIKSTEYETQIFRWMPLNKLNSDSVTLPIDKVVIQKLLLTLGS